MIENEKIAQYWQNALSLGTEFFGSTNTLYQGIMIAASIVLGIIVYRIAKGRLVHKIEALDAPYVVKRIYRNLIRLVLPLTALITLFISTQIAKTDLIGLDVTLSVGVMKVILAWIMIRIAVQFIANSAVRNFFGVVIWAIAALSIFGLLEDTMTTLDSLGFSIGDFRLSALAVIKSLLMIFALLYFAIFISSFAERRIFKIKSLSRSSQVLMGKVIRICMIVFALLIGITSAGIDLSLFAVFGGAIGLGIGFGLQKGISNLFSGMLLLIDQSIKPGDVLELENGTFGWVNSMAGRYTEIITRDNKSFLIPNEEFITQRVVNWSHGDSLIRIEVKFGVHYKSNPHEIKALAVAAVASAGSRICNDKEPVCHMTEFGDSSLNFTLRFWIKDAEQGLTNVRGDVMLALWDTFKENGIEIPYPHREVYMHEAK